MRSAVLVLAVFAMLFFAPEHLYAYVGPGAGLSALGALFALISSVFVAIFGFIWFPIKRLIRRARRRREARAEIEADAG